MLVYKIGNIIRRKTNNLQNKEEIYFDDSMNVKKIQSDRFLRLAFLVGGCYDIILGISLLFLSDFLEILFSISKPEPIIFPQTTGILLVVIGYFLVITREVKKFAFIGAGSCVIRLTYTFLTLFTWISQGIEVWYLFFALTDGLTGLFLLLALIMTEGVSWENLWKP
ncbi:MAG: hypothetical protein ACXAC8_16055 [Candidatus Hodarchaeales archaeon]|jgi:hypothetical protein